MKKEIRILKSALIIMSALLVSGITLSYSLNAKKNSNQQPSDFDTKGGIESTNHGIQTLQLAELKCGEGKCGSGDDESKDEEKNDKKGKKKAEPKDDKSDTKCGEGKCGGGDDDSEEGGEG